MFQPISLFIGLRYSRSRNRTGFVSFITFFSIAGIFLGVASLIIVVSVMNGFEGELKKRILGLVPHVIVAEQVDSKSFNWQEKRELFLQLDDVKNVTPLVETEALIASAQSIQGVLVQGILPAYEEKHIISNNMVVGDLQSLEETPYSVVIGYALSKKLDIDIGDLVRIVLPNKTIFTPMGRIPVQRTFTVTGIFNVGSQVDDSMVYIHANSAAKLLRRKGDGIAQLRIYLNDAFGAQQFVQREKSLDASLSFTSWSQSQGTLFSAVKMEKNMMWIMLSLIVAVAAFNIVSALVMVVIEKQGEIGILQTLGMSREGIMKIFITQGMVNGLWGVIFGAIAGVVTVLNINQIMASIGVSILGNGYATQILPVQLNGIDVIVIVLSALAMSFFATLYPAYRASKTSPAEVLRNE